MSVTLDIVRTYRAPAEIARRRSAGAPNEARALAVLMAGCVVMFISRLPGIARQAHLDPEVPREALMTAALMGWVFFAPLFFYGLAALSHLIARALGGRGTHFEARIALFWALLASTPVWLLVGLVEGFVGPGSTMTAAGVAAVLAFLVFWGSGLWAVERGQRTAP